jgi:hypothetical protein
MVLSMAVVGLVVAVIYVFVPHDDAQDPVKPVSYRVELDTARRAAPYPVAAPEGLSKDWRATSVRYTPGTKDGSVWHLGFIDPTGEYVAVEQSDGRPARFIGSVSRNAEETGESQRVGEQQWARYEGSKYDALVLEERGVTTVVTGTAPFGQLATMAEALTSS